jgi:hypothetical protein
VRLATPLIVLLLLAALAGCGSEEETTPQAVEGALTERVRAQWQRNPDCRPEPGASRWGCSVGAYRCQGVVTDRGWSVSCAKPGRSIAFTIRR